MSVISLTERFENMTETEGVDIIKELPQAQLYETKAKIDDLQSLNCALETENMEPKNQVIRLIKNNYELTQCLKTFTEDDLKSQEDMTLPHNLLNFQVQSHKNHALFMFHLLMVMKVKDLLYNNIQSQKLMVSTKIQLL